MRFGRTWWRRRVPLALAAPLALGLAALLVRLPASQRTRALFPAHAPAPVAYLLADFSTHPHAGSWRVQWDSHNYTWWRYSVRLDCGAWCAGSVLVEAVERHAAAPQHAAHAAPLDHSVRLHRSLCTALPLLGWPSFCEEMEVNAVVTGDGSGGAVVEESARALCAAPLTLSGVCAQRLRDYRRQHLQRIRFTLPPLH